MEKMKGGNQREKPKDSIVSVEYFGVFIEMYTRVRWKLGRQPPGAARQQNGRWEPHSVHRWSQYHLLRNYQGLERLNWEPPMFLHPRNRGSLRHHGHSTVGLEKVALFWLRYLAYAEEAESGLISVYELFAKGSERDKGILQFKPCKKKTFVIFELK